MMQSVIERAYELASSGRCKSLIEVEYALTRENFEMVHFHLRSPRLRKDLAKLMNDSDDENTD